jgi:hypothetical protein
MSIDTLGRAAAQGLRDAQQPADATALLRDLHHTRRQRSRRNVGLAAAAAVVVTVVGVVTVTERADTKTAPAINHGIDLQYVPCAPEPTLNLTCVSDTRWRFSWTLASGSPVQTTFVIPRSLQAPWIGPRVVASSNLFFPAAGVRDPAVEIMYDVTAVKVGPGQSARTSRVVIDHSAGQTLASLAHWMTHRPGVRINRLARDSVSGMPAYYLDVSQTLVGDLRGGYGPLLSSRGPDKGSRHGLSQNWFGLDVPERAQIYLVQLTDGSIAAVITFRVPSTDGSADALIASLHFGS